MTEQEARFVTDSAKQQFELIYRSDSDVTQAMLWLNELMHLIASDYYASANPLGLLLFPNQIPIDDKRIVEVFRVFANVLELRIEINSRDENKKK